MKKDRMLKGFIVLLICLACALGASASTLELSKGSMDGLDVKKDFAYASMRVSPENSYSLSSKHSQTLIVKNTYSSDLYFFVDVYASKGLQNVQISPLTKRVVLHENVYESCPDKGICETIHEWENVTEYVPADTLPDAKTNWGEDYHEHTTQGVLIKKGEERRFKVTYSTTEDSGKWNARIWATSTNDWSKIITEQTVFDYALDPSWSRGTAGLLHYWTMDETSGSILQDFNNTLNLTKQGTPPMNSMGVINTSIYGNNISTNFFNATPPPFTDSNTARTANLWVNLTDWTLGQTSVFFAWNKNGGGFWSLRRQNSGGLILQTRDATDTGFNNVNIQGNVNGWTGWQMVTLVYNGSHMFTYVNGTLKTNSSLTFGDRSARNKAIRLLNSLDGANHMRDGTLDEFGIWNDVLTKAQIECLYNGGIPGGEQQPPFTGACPSGPGGGTFSITATDVYNSSNVLNFSALINGTNYFTSNGTINTTLVSNSTVSIIVYNATNYFNVTYANYNLSSSLDANLTPYAQVFANSALDGSPMTSFIVNYTSANDSGSVSSVSGVSWLPLSNQNYTLLIYDATNGTTNYSKDTALVQANPYLQNYTFSLYTSQSINFTFRDEITSDILYANTADQLITVEFIGSLASYNFTANGTLYVELLTPDVYTIRYQREGYGRKRSYILDVTAQSHNMLDLYLLNDTISSDLTVTVYDQTTLASIENAVVYLQRYNLSSNAYETVGMYETDVAGNAYFDVEDQNELYKFQVDKPFKTIRLLTNPLYIETATINLYIDLGSVAATPFFAAAGISGSITYDNSTNLLTGTWSDPANSASQICFYLKEWTQYAQTVINSSCSTSSAGSISLAGLTQNTTYYGLLTGTIDGEVKVLATGWVTIPGEELGSGAFGVFLAAGFFMMFAFLTYIHYTMGIFAIISLVFSKLFGILPIDWGYIIVMVIAGLILSAIISRRR